MKKILPCILPALFMLLLIGLQSAFSCQVPVHAEHQYNSIQVNTCHASADTTEPYICCDSATCHYNQPPLRHLGSPELASQIKYLLPLILESRQQLPQPKSSPVFEQPLNDLHSPSLVLVTSQAPPLRLTLLDSTILRH